jgi:hypothetical protein
VRRCDGQKRRQRGKAGGSARSGGRGWREWAELGQYLFLGQQGLKANWAGAVADSSILRFCFMDTHFTRVWAVGGRGWAGLRDGEVAQGDGMVVAGLVGQGRASTQGEMG